MSFHHSFLESTLAGEESDRHPEAMHQQIQARHRARKSKLNQEVPSSFFARYIERDKFIKCLQRRCDKIHRRRFSFHPLGNSVRFLLGFSPSPCRALALLRLGARLASSFCGSSRCGLRVCLELPTPGQYFGPTKNLRVRKVFAVVSETYK
jgi:hypothetical protein